MTLDYESVSSFAGFLGVCVCVCVCLYNSSLRDDVSGLPNCRVIQGCVRSRCLRERYICVCVCPQVTE